MSITFTLVLALLVDSIIGEPKKYHPLVLFANIAKKVEQKLNQGSNFLRFCKGILAWCFVVLPIPICFYWLQSWLPFYLLFAINIYIVYWAVALNSLKQHGMQIYQPLKEGDLKQAQHFCSYIVSRDTNHLNEREICRATTESMLENGHDAVTATLIYFVIGGAPLVVIHRLSNTLDAMWGYRSQQYCYFGKFSARMDDLLGFISAKITTFLFAIFGLLNRKVIKAISNAYQQSKTYKSHNGGWVMASGATVINVSLGGKSIYFGKTVCSPQLGEGESAQIQHIKSSLSLINKATLLWVLLVFVGELLLL